MIQFLKTEDYTSFINFIKETHPNSVIQIFDEEEIDYREILFEIYNTSIFSDQRIIAIRNPKEITSKINSIETEDYIYVNIKRDIKDIETKIIAKESIDNFILSLFSKNNIKINSIIKNYLKTNFIDDKNYIKNEFVKIVNYIYPEKEISNPQFIIDNIITKKNNIVIWDLINAINKNDKKELVLSYEILKECDSDVRGIMSMILRQIEIIILVNTYRISSNKALAEKLRKKPFSFNITEYGLTKLKENRYDNDKLKELYHKLINLYSLSNSGLMDMDLGILLILLRL